MARNEKKFKHLRLRLFASNAQSTLEYAIIFPMLFFMIMGIWELAFMWHQYNSMEFALQDISSNIALLDGNICTTRNDVKDIITKRTAILHPTSLSYSSNTNGNMINYISNQQYKNTPIVNVNIDCNVSTEYDNLSPTVQLQVTHKLLFFTASLPDFRTGGRIEIIPSNVKLVSTKSATARQF